MQRRQNIACKREAIKTSSDEPEWKWPQVKLHAVK
jgi:hypothetical protein